MTSLLRPRITNHQGKLRLVWSILLSFFLLLILPTIAWAHPLGNFTVNRYSRFELNAKQLDLLYIIDMAEIPTNQERNTIDTDNDGKISSSEQDTYLAKQVEILKDNLHLTVENTPISLDTQETVLEFPPGQANLPTLRLTAHFVVALPTETDTWQVDYQDNNYQERIGWQEVLVRANIGTRILESTVADDDVSQELRTYPIDMLQDPLKVNSATFRFTTEAGTGAPDTIASGNQSGSIQSLPINPGGPTRTTDRFADLISAPIVGPGAFLLLMLAAFGWGAFHAFSPGHGKTIVGAYLVGSRGTIGQALFLGLVTTLTHTVGVFALGLITLLASQYILPEKLFPWLSLLSGLMVVTIGISLARSRFQSLRPSRRVVEPVMGQDHPGGQFLHEHDSGFTHRHALAGADGAGVSWRNLFVLGVSGGIIPCPSALVMMLGAIALQRVAVGLVLILIFSIGLASVLTIFGILFIHTSKLFQRIPESGRLFRILPVASAVFIALVGIGISWQALSQTGLFGMG